MVLGLAGLAAAGCAATSTHTPQHTTATPAPADTSCQTSCDGQTALTQADTALTVTCRIQATSTYGTVIVIVTNITSNPVAASYVNVSLTDTYGNLVDVENEPLLDSYNNQVYTISGHQTASVAFKLDMEGISSCSAQPG